MINTILFDLDGTLASMDSDLFTERYFKQLSEKLKDYFTLEELTKALWISTEYMKVKLDKKQTNEDAFYEKFYEIIPHSKEELQPLLEEYYENDFYKLGSICKENEKIINAVKLLKEKNYNLVVATNPMFPISAVVDRINWAGFKEEDFTFMTSFETMHFCKPQLGFYKEILKSIDKNPSECIMVGNHVEEDMVAKEIGISTYLIEDFAMGDIKNDTNIDYRGNYEEFNEFVKKLPDL